MLLFLFFPVNDMPRTVLRCVRVGCFFFLQIIGVVGKRTVGLCMDFLVVLPGMGVSESLLVYCSFSPHDFSSFTPPVHSFYCLV